MIAVGGPVTSFTVFTFLAHDDDGVEKSAQLGDDGLKFTYVSVRKIPLIRGRLDYIDGESRHNEPMTAEWFALRRQDFSAVVFDGFLQFADFARRSAGQSFFRLESKRFTGKFSALAWRPRLLPWFFLGHKSLCLLNIAPVIVPSDASSAERAQRPKRSSSHNPTT